MAWYFSLILCVVIVVVFYVGAFLVNKKLDKAEKNKQKSQTQTSMQTKFQNLEQQKLIKKTFGFKPMLVDAEKLCPTLEFVLDKEMYFDGLYKNLKICVNFEELEEIVRSKDFKTLGYQKLLRYLGDYGIKCSKEFLQKASKNLTAENVASVDGQKLFDIGVMLLFGVGCEQNLKNGFSFLCGAAYLGHEQASKIVRPFLESVFNGDGTFQFLDCCTLWENLWLLKRGDFSATKKFAEKVFDGFNAKQKTTNDECFEFALKCAEKVANSQPKIWLKMAKMLLQNGFSNFPKQTIKFYLTNSIKFCPTDSAQAKKLLADLEN